MLVALPFPEETVLCIGSRWSGPEPSRERKQRSVCDKMHYDYCGTTHHLKHFHDLRTVGAFEYRQTPLFKVILLSWGIAFFEYCFQVPANRFGSYEFTAVQLKTIQEVITLIVFAAFSVLYLDAELKWNYFVGFVI